MNWPAWVFLDLFSDGSNVIPKQCAVYGLRYNCKTMGASLCNGVPYSVNHALGDDSGIS